MHNVFPLETTGGAQILLKFFELREHITVEGLINQLRQKAVALGKKLFASGILEFNKRRV